MPPVTENSSMTVERNRRQVTILPKPLHDPRITRQLKERYTEADGWNHSAHFAVYRFCTTVAEAKALEERLRNAPETENSSFYVVEYQRRKGSTWYDYFKWCDTREQARQLIEEQIGNRQRYGTLKMNYRIRRIPRVLRNPLPAKKPDAQATKE